ncbi:MAG: ComEC/Rec2 family competence protein [Bacteroidales bacterium]|nr:ComEC/Rec2 family competence protein [Bacteroidales bacterium]
MFRKFFEKRPIFLPLVILIVTIIVYDSCCPVIFFRSHYIKHTNSQTEYFKYVIKSKPKQTKKGNHFSYTAKTVAYFSVDDSQWHECTGDIKLYIPKYCINAERNPEVDYLDTIITKNNLLAIKNFDSSFNYVRYMRHQRIYHSVFANDFELHKRKKTSNIFELSFDINEKLRNVLLNTLDKKTSSVAIAMLLGDKTEMDDEVRQSFNASGLAHLLCVSGLHIMILIGFFSFLFKWVLPPNIIGFYSKQVILVLLSWTIAFIVGLTPSSMRVATMLSILFISEIFLLNNDRLNILLLTAFIFLLINPLILFNVSFQLSFLAVLGILAFKPWINNRINKTITLLPIRNHLLNRLLYSISSNVSVSIAVQLCCLPVLLFYFKSFPLFAIIGNLVAIPLAQIILITLVFFLFLAQVPIISASLSYILQMEIDALIYIAELGSKWFA